MAIQNLLGNYIRLNYPESYIKNNSVYCGSNSYATPLDREKEKEREEQFRIFIENFNNSYYGDLNSIIEKQTDEEPALARFYGIWELFYSPVRFVYDRIFDDEELEALIPLGFEIEWIKDPINIHPLTVSYCGKVGEKADLSYGFFYSKLKESMSGELFDV